jgi:thiol:disulfide interchange protein DsbD
MRYIYLLLPLLFQSYFASAQILEPVKWSDKVEWISDTEMQVTFTATIDDGWATYSQSSDPDGPIPTSVNFDGGDHFELMGEAEEVGKKKEGPEPLFDNVVVAKFEKEVSFVQKIKILKPGVAISGYINYMACDSERCTPPTDHEFSLSSAGGSNGPAKGGTQSVEGEPETDMVEQEAPSGNILKPVKWSYSVDQGDSEGEYILKMDAKVQDGWYIYSQFIDEGGPVPTSFMFEEEPHYELIGKVEEVSDHKVSGFDKIFEMEVTKFKKTVSFQQKIKTNDPAKAIKGSLEFMTCDDTRCLPPEFVDFEITPSGERGDAGATGSTGGGIIEGNTIDQIVPSIRETYVSPLGNCGEEDVARGDNYLWTFFLGFLGGLVALLTPCVFPMIPLTVSFFTKDTKRKGWVNALIYGLSIIVIYVTIGLMITGFFGATALNELSTNALANVIFFLIFVAFAFSFFGYYEITLPSSWANKSDRMADKGGLIGIFFMAFTLALVSVSCTGPIIGSAIVQSATSAIGPFIVMLGFSMALAIPFGLFAAFPAFLNSLPKSGSWMNSVKVVLGFLELALALKFLSVADMTMHWGILKYELFMGLWVVIFALMTLYLFGFIKFPHDSPLKKLSPTRWIFSLGSLALTIYLATGFFINEKTDVYNSLKLMSGLAPPATYNILLPEPEVDPLIKAKYSSYTKCANNLDCFKDYHEGLAYAKEVGKPVFLDFTGYGCVNCRKTEEHIWIDEEVSERLQDDFVLVSLYVDDRKTLEEILVSINTGKKLRNVGNKWADFQIVNFEQNSQPLYVMMTTDEEVLAAPRGYKEGVEGYREYLSCGLDVFSKL